MGSQRVTWLSDWAIRKTTLHVNLRLRKTSERKKILCRFFHTTLWFRVILRSVQHHITKVFLSQNLYSGPPDMRNHSLSLIPHSVEYATILLCTPQGTNMATLKYKIIWAINFFVWMNYCWFSQECLHFIRGSKEKKKKKHLQEIIWTAWLFSLNRATWSYLALGREYSILHLLAGKS